MRNASQLIDAVKRALGQGYSKEEVTESMKKQGYSDSEISDTFASVANPVQDISSNIKKESSTQQQTPEPQPSNITSRPTTTSVAPIATTATTAKGGISMSMIAIIAVVTLIIGVGGYVLFTGGLGAPGIEDGGYNQSMNSGNALPAGQGTASAGKGNPANALGSQSSKYECDSEGHLTEESWGKLIKSGNLSDISDLTCLKHLDLSYAKYLKGSLSDLSDLTDLEFLGLSETQVTGSLSDLSGLTNLTLLALTNAQVTGSLSDLSGLTSLTTLYFSDINVTGSLSDLSGLTNLTRLTLNAQVTGCEEFEDTHPNIQVFCYSNLS